MSGGRGILIYSSISNKVKGIVPRILERQERSATMVRKAAAPNNDSLSSYSTTSGWKHYNKQSTCLHCLLFFFLLTILLCLLFFSGRYYVLSAILFTSYTLCFPAFRGVILCGFLNINQSDYEVSWIPGFQTLRFQTNPALWICAVLHTYWVIIMESAMSCTPIES